MQQCRAIHGCAKQTHLFLCAASRYLVPTSTETAGSAFSVLSPPRSHNNNRTMQSPAEASDWLLGAFHGRPDCEHATPEQQQVLVRAASLLTLQESCAAFLQQPGSVQALLHSLGSGGGSSGSSGSSSSSSSSMDAFRKKLALLAFCALATVADGRAALLQQGDAIMQALHGCLQHSSEFVKVGAAQAIALFMLPPEVRATAAHPSKGALLELLRGGSHVTQHPLSAELRSLAAIAQPAHTLEALLSCLDSSSQAVTEAATDAVVSTLLHQYLLAIADVQSAEPLSAALARCMRLSSPAAVVELALKLLLGCLSSDEQHVRAIAQHGGLCQAVAACMCHSNTAIAESASGAVAILTLTADGRSALLQQEGLLASLIRSLISKSSSVKSCELAAHTIAALAPTPEGCNALLQRPNAIVALVQCLNHNSDEVALACALSLAQLAWTNGSSSVLLQHEGLMPALSSCLTHARTQVVQMALAAMGGLAGEQQACLALQRQPGCMAGIVACLGYDAEGVREAAVLCCNRLSYWLCKAQPDVPDAVWEAVGSAISGRPSQAQVEIDACVDSLRQVVAGMDGGRC